MQENFLHFLWRYRRFDATDLRTTEGDAVEVLSVGEHNNHSGPDFLNARVRIGETLWAGNVEIHTVSSAWAQHRHQSDAAYQNVVLHVVLHEDTPATLADGTRIPCLELFNRVPAEVLARWQQMLDGAPLRIPCAAHVGSVSGLQIGAWLDRVLVERLEQKTGLIEEILTQTQHNWEETCYRLVSKSLGGSVNAEPFEWLARSLPLAILGKYKDQLETIEALLFGQAGLLTGEFEEAYPKRLQQTHRILAQKHQLIAMPEGIWKFSKMRPANFPTVRIAQLSMLIHTSVHLFRKSVEADSLKTLTAMYEVGVSDYWNTHYRFGSVSAKRQKHLGKDAVRSLIINTIVPLVFVYGRHKADTDLLNSALHWLETLPAEDNHIIEEWKSLGVVPDSAAQSQGLLQLHRHYCATKQCLNCGIGAAILK